MTVSFIKSSVICFLNLIKNVNDQKNEKVIIETPNYGMSVSTFTDLVGICFN